MSLLHRTHPAPHVEATSPTLDTEIRPTAENVPAQRVPRTRTASAWVAVGAAAIIAVALIVFLVQNTRSTEISFLWLTTSTSLAVSLLIAAVGGVLLTLIVGTARITQLRRFIRKPHN